VFSDASDGGFGDALATAGVARRSSAADLLELDALCAAAEAAAPASGPALTVPDWPKGMRLVLETDVDTSLEALVECIWSDAAAADGGFVKCVCAARGESEVRITPWGAARGGGFQRDFTFRCVHTHTLIAYPHVAASILTECTRVFFACFQRSGEGLCALLWAEEHLLPPDAALPPLRPARLRAAHQPGHERHPLRRLLPVRNTHTLSYDRLCGRMYGRSMPCHAR
jgi:hypothetical protein